jgi:hypothetical protein
MAKDFKSLGLGISKAIEQAKARGINKALGIGRTEMAKRLKTDTGVNVKTLKTRIGIYPARVHRQYGWLYVGFKFGLKISEFKPKEKDVRVTPARASGAVGRPRSRVYKGTTIKIGNAGRQLIDGVFPSQSGRGITLWLARKLAYTTGKYVRGKTKNRPTFVPMINPIKDSALNSEKAVSKVIDQAFERSVLHEIQYGLSKIK